MTRCACSTCFYCLRPLDALRHEHDHFPIPARHGGTDTVPACTECHDLKDRFRLRDWPIGDLIVGMDALPREARIMVARAVAAFLDHGGEL